MTWTDYVIRKLYENFILHKVTRVQSKKEKTDIQKEKVKSHERQEPKP